MVSAYNRISNNVYKTHNVGTSSQVLKNLDFSSNLLLFNRFQSFDDTLLVVCNIDTLKYFRVFTTSYFTNNFVIVLGSSEMM